MGVFWIPSEGGNEDVALFDFTSSWYSDVQLRRRQIRPRLELPICTDGSDADNA